MANPMIGPRSRAENTMDIGPASQGPLTQGGAVTRTTREAATEAITKPMGIDARQTNARDNVPMGPRRILVPGFRLPQFLLASGDARV